MLKFYQRAALGLLGVIVLSILLAYLGFKFTFLHAEILPNRQSAWPWFVETASDQISGGHSIVAMDDAEVNLSFRFTISDSFEYPYAHAALVFNNEAGQPVAIDLSRYDTLSFSVKCTPNNTLTFTLLTVDDEITKPGDLLTYRAPATFFSCSEQWSQVTLDLTRLETPQWWFEMFGIELSQQAYSLASVPRVVFGSSIQSPRHTPSAVQLHNIVISGRDLRALYVATGLVICLWLLYGTWFFRQYTVSLTQSLKDKIQKDLPLVAYQQLTMEPHHDKEKSAILRYMATCYANEELNQELMVKELGISRTKINDILKSELGYTFITYLNKLRLTEAARLLTEKDEINISEIAYSVGYRNVSYFNKLFKEEYGCTPKTFKSLCNTPTPEV